MQLSTKINLWRPKNLASRLHKKLDWLLAKKLGTSFHMAPVGKKDERESPASVPWSCQEHPPSDHSLGLNNQTH